MSDLVSGGIVSGAVSLANNFINRKTQQQINTANHQHDFDMMREQQSYNLAGLASQREYDSPLEQKKRLMRAGINAFTAENMVSSGSGISQQALTPQNTPAQFQPFNFDVSAIYDALKTQSELSNQRNLQSKEHKHAKDILEKELEHSSAMQDLQHIHQRTMAYDSFLHDLNKIQLNRQDIEDSQAHQLQMQQNQFSENATERTFQSQQQQRLLSHQSEENSFRSAMDVLKNSQAMELQRDLQKLEHQHQIRMKDKDIDFQTRKEEVEFDKWKTPYVEDKSPFWFNHTAGEKNTRYPYNDRNISNPWRQP